MKIETAIRLADFTTFRIGGACEVFIRIRSEKDLRDAMDWCAENNKKYFVLGGGSNVLAPDEGFEEAILRMEIGGIILEEKERLRCGAGTALSAVVDFACQNGLAGLERLKGIPGTVGGAVRGNAGAFGVQMQDVIDRVIFYDTKNASIKECDAAACKFSYRMSVFKEKSSRIITSVVFHLKTGKPKVLTARAEETLAMRNERQIQDIQSAGSCFINPVVSREVQQEFERLTGKVSKGGRVPAGWLLETVGFKGVERDGIAASAMHPNYFINTGKGTARAVRALIEQAKQKVEQKWNVKLSEEVVVLQ